MFAIILAVMGTRLLSFLFCREYGKDGITAVMRLADAVLHADKMIKSSISESFGSMKDECPDWITYTS